MPYYLENRYKRRKTRLVNFYWTRVLRRKKCRRATAHEGDAARVGGNGRRLAFGFPASPEDFRDGPRESDR